jgi:hypothetical protein
MKNLMVFVSLMVLLTGVSLAADPMAVKGEDVTISGQLSCTFCKLAGGIGHKCEEGCCQACVKSGDAPLLMDEKNNLYMLINKEKEKPLITDANIKLVGGKVTVKGILVKTGGLQGIYVEKMEKMAEAVPAK